MCITIISISGVLEINRFTRFIGGVSEGYILPVVIALGFGISTVSVLGLKTVATNSTTLSTQYYNQLALEAAQAGMTAVQACIMSTPSIMTTSDWQWSNTTPVKTFTPQTDCALNPVSGRSLYVANNVAAASSSDVSYSSTYTVNRPSAAPGDTATNPSAAIVTSTGTLYIKNASGTIVSTITKTIRSLMGTGSGTGGASTSYKQASVISVGPKVACTIATDPAKGRDWAYCWGDNSNKMLGDGINHTTSSYSKISLYPVAVSDGPQSSPQVSVAWNKCSSNPWTGYPTCATDPGGAMAGKNVIDISVGANHVCAIATDVGGANGRAYCWGEGGSGQLGNNGTADSNVPVRVDTSGVLAGVNLKKISAGNGFTCALSDIGRVYCWGEGSVGQLGNGGSADSRIPVAVDISGALSGKTVKSLARVQAGGDTMCVTDSDDTAYCWGQSGLGQTGTSAGGTSWSWSHSLCDGYHPPPPLPEIKSNKIVASPVAIPTTLKFADITIWGGSRDSSVSTTTSGAVWGYVSAKALNGSSPNRMYEWGGIVTYYRTYKTCGNGGGNKVNGGANVTYNYSTTPNGPLYTSGNLNTALGLNSGNPYDGYFCGQSNTSQLYCDVHGQGAASGQCGNNATSCNGAQPVSMSSFDGYPPIPPIDDMETSDNFTCAISNKLIYCWGEGTGGQLGNGSESDKKVPTKVDTLQATSALYSSASSSSTSTGYSIKVGRF